MPKVQTIKRQNRAGSRRNSNHVPANHLQANPPCACLLQALRAPQTAMFRRLNQPGGFQRQNATSRPRRKNTSRHPNRRGEFQRQNATFHLPRSSGFHPPNRRGGSRRRRPRNRFAAPHPPNPHARCQPGARSRPRTTNRRSRSGPSGLHRRRHPSRRCNRCLRQHPPANAAVAPPRSCSA